MKIVGYYWDTLEWSTAVHVAYQCTFLYHAYHSLNCCFGQRQADVMIVAGTLTNKMAPALRKVLVDAMVHGGEKNFLKYLYGRYVIFLVCFFFI